MGNFFIGLLAVSLVTQHVHCDADFATSTGNGSHYGEEGRLIRDLLDTGYDVRERPFVQDGGPVFFNMTLYLSAISDLDARTQTLSGLSWLLMDWYDNRLTWDPNEYAGIGSFTVNIHQTWSPKIYLQNSILEQPPANPIQKDVTQTYISHDGRVHLESPLLHHTSCDLKLQKFPFDEQECWLRFTMQNTPIHLVRLESISVIILGSVINSEFDLLSPVTRTSLFPIPSNITYEITEIGYRLKRLPRFYIKNVISPIALISWLAMVAFIIPAKSGERLSAAISLVLGLTVFQIVITDQMPKNSRGETVVVIQYVSDCFIITIAVVVMTAIVVNLIHREGCIHNKLIRSVFFDHLGQWFLVGGGGCGKKNAPSSNPGDSGKDGDLEMKDAAAGGKATSTGGQDVPRHTQLAWMNGQSTSRFEEQAQSEVPKTIPDFELLARILDRIFMFATLISLSAITLKFLMLIS